MLVNASLALAMIALPGIAASPPPLPTAPPPVVAAPPVAAPPPVTAPPPAAPAVVTVARYTFDAGADAAGRVADSSGRGTALTVRAADGGQVTFTGTAADKDAAFPAACAATATTCPRAVLEGTDDPDLDPGTRLFRWGAAVHLTKAQLTGSANVVQKGVAGTESQWKLQIGARLGKAQCAVAGQGSATIYLARSSVGVADAKWHDVMCQRSGAVLAVFVDGVERGRVSVPATLSIANGRSLRIAGPNLNVKSERYHGQLDDVYARLG